MSKGPEIRSTSTDGLWTKGDWWATSGEDEYIEAQGSTTFPTKASTGVIERLKNRVGKMFLKLGVISLAGAAVLVTVD